ncbi:thiamine monophosphate synthase [Sphingopyxis sp. Root1497]|uniref:thiamine phosphate synthase n=1 Tax=Sphingopyxis sp. Root1497 TaxID=1736474 RepID=UPI0006FDA04E|nr:thiamine phosphate synthase [Sphingopyxis sp. Root1497]KQZ65591.1 thiamine monophosphate synthase [Sphingopyxis sp. Root1497]
MPRRHPFSRPSGRLPQRWLFTDARLGDAVLAAAAALPPGSGIVIRDDDRAPGDRWRLVRHLARIAKTRSLLLLLAGPPALARRWGAGGVHLRRHHAKHAPQARRLGLIVSMPVHDPREARTARRARADLAFVSPLHPTRSHPGAPALGPAAWLRLARLAKAQAIALGGMTPARARALHRASAHEIPPGWAAIDHWLEKAVKRRS